MKTPTVEPMNPQPMIDRICSEIEPGTFRQKALKEVRWVLHCPQLGLWAGMNGLSIVPTEKQSATVFDGRDSVDNKRRFYRLATGIDWQPVMV
jgi:hypothetical protein